MTSDRTKARWRDDGPAARLPAVGRKEDGAWTHGYGGAVDRKLAVRASKWRRRIGGNRDLEEARRGDKDRQET
jgi:hypothetical protein